MVDFPSDFSELMSTQEFLVTIRQSLLFCILLLAGFFLWLSRFGHAVHEWLQISWKLLGTILAVFLIVSGLVKFASSREGMAVFLAVLEVVEVMELFFYVFLAIAVSFIEEQVPALQIGLFTATLLFSTIWMFSSLVEIFASNSTAIQPQLHAFMISTATCVIVTLALGDFCLLALCPDARRNPWQKSINAEEAADYEPGDTSMPFTSGFIAEDVATADGEFPS